MSLKDSLKKAGEQGRDATRRVLGNAREQWEDAERRIRAGMRIHPRPKTQQPMAKSSFAVQPQEVKLNSADPALDQDLSRAREASVQQSTKARKGNAA